jgi:alpha-L-rhamnosidase
MTAKELGEFSDFNKYDTLKDEIFNAILAEFFSPNGRLTVHTQTGYILSLYYKIYRDGKKDAIIKGFNERLTIDGYKLKTGFTGTPLILLALFDNGLDTDAYRFSIIIDSLDGFMQLI